MKNTMWKLKNENEIDESHKSQLIAIRILILCRDRVKDVN